MAVARINIKNIDYFKFKKIVIDGNRDDYKDCSREVRALCDHVQTLNFRDDEFDDISDRQRLAEICTYYQQIIKSKRIDSVDMRIKSGWWGDHKNAYSAGKIKPAVLRDILIAKTKEWLGRHGVAQLSESDIPAKIDGPGHFVFKHKEHQCFQYVGKADKIFSRCGEKLKAAFEGSINEPLSALLAISMTSDWDFYFIPVDPADDERIFRVLENDLILKHDCIWPHGLNFSLQISSLLEVSEFRKSCLRHDWPPDSDTFDEPEIDLESLRRQVAVGVMSDCLTPEGSVCGDTSDGRGSGASTPRGGPQSPSKSAPKPAAARPTTPRTPKAAQGRPKSASRPSVATKEPAHEKPTPKRPTSAAKSAAGRQARAGLPRPTTPKKRTLPKPPPAEAPAPAVEAEVSPDLSPEPVSEEAPAPAPPVQAPPAPTPATNGTHPEQPIVIQREREIDSRTRTPSPAGSTGSNKTYTLDQNNFSKPDAPIPDESLPAT